MIAYLLGGIMSVELVAPELCVHLQPNVFEVGLSVYLGDVTFSHIVEGSRPVAIMIITGQLFPSKLSTNFNFNSVAHEIFKGN